MKKWFVVIAALFAFHAQGASILWAALDESADINGIAFRTYTDPASHFVNAARLSISDAGISQSDYSMDAVVQLALWIPPFDGDDGYWEEDFPVVCLKYEDEDWEMPKWSSQFNLGDNPNLNATVFFELGYVSDWDDFDNPSFITLATAIASVQDLIDARHIYPSGTLNPPIEADWMPTHFHAVPEPSTAVLALLGCTLLLRRRK